MDMVGMPTLPERLATGQSYILLVSDEIAVEEQGNVHEKKQAVCFSS
jgi:hypothetical protein